MKAPRALLSLGVIVALAVTASGCSADGVSAFTVNGADVSQRSVDGELRALAESPTLRQLFSQAGGDPLSRTEGSVTSSIGAGWVGLLVLLRVAGLEVRHRGLATTTADRRTGRAFARNAVGGAPALTSLPAWLQDRLTSRWTAVAVLQRTLLRSPSKALAAEVAQRCGSGRYVSHILVKTRALADSLKGELDAGADFAKLARSDSKDPGSATNGGRLGCLDDLQGLVAPFAAVAKTQPIGVVSDVVETEFGFHLVLVTDQAPADVPYNATIAAIRRRARHTDVEVDSRYGRWDAKNGQVLPPNTPTADSSSKQSTATSSPSGSSPSG